MKTFVLKPVKATLPVLRKLEKRGLLRTFAPTPRVLKLREGEDGAVDTIYTTAPRYGTHKLLAVGKNATGIALTTHPDNEDFLIINTTKLRFKPLFLVVGLHSKRAFEEKAARGALTARDIVALELEYNGPASVFTMYKDTPHCEVTAEGKGMHPVFFVTEPSDFAMDYVKMPEYRLELAKGKK